METGSVVARLRTHYKAFLCLGKKGKLVYLLGLMFLTSLVFHAGCRRLEELVSHESNHWSAIWRSIY